MIRITKQADLVKILDAEICSYINYLLETILGEDQKNCHTSIEEIGAIFLLEGESDWMQYPAMGLSAPVTESRFEWIEPIENGYCNGCIVIDNDRAINIIGKQEFFMKFKEAFT